MTVEKWYRRLAEVPRIQYEPDPSIDRTKLPGHEAVPAIHQYEFDGRLHESLHWPMKDGSTSASPSHCWETKPRKGESESKRTLRQLRECLELPGKLTDYHFAIQNCHNTLEGFAREEPWVFEEVERLCWLDIRLISEYPETITLEPIVIADKELAKIAAERRGERRFFSVSAFHHLMGMYEREGYLREALEVAKIAERFEQCSGKVEEILERLDRIDAEATTV